MPALLARLLDSTWFGYVARAGLTFVFWTSGFAKLTDFNGAAAEMQHFGLAPPALFAAATILVQLLGSALIIANRFAWLGCGMLAVFAIMTIPIAHNFWTMQEPMRTLEFFFVMEHLSLISGLAVMAILSRKLGGAGAG